MTEFCAITIKAAVDAASWAIHDVGLPESTSNYERRAIIAKAVIDAIHALSGALMPRRAPPALEPCPFCQGTDIEFSFDGGGTPWHTCMNCGASLNPERWDWNNRRASGTEAAGELFNVLERLTYAVNGIGFNGASIESDEFAMVNKLSQETLDKHRAALSPHAKEG